MCTSIMAGKKATHGNLIILARNEDYAKNNWNKYLTFRPFPEYGNAENNNPVVEDGLWTLGNGLQVPVPENAFSYSAMPDWAAFQEASRNIKNRYFFEERGINKKDVAISATNSMEDINERVKKLDPFVSPGIEEAIIPTLILPQATTAKMAVLVLGDYVNLYGAAEGNGILFGDSRESWYMEIGSGHHWIAVKIPDEVYLAVANGLRIHSINIDSEDVLHSEGLFQFVTDNYLLDDPQRRNFNFAKAFGNPGNPYNVDRIWLAQKILTPSKKQDIRQAQYPLFLKPDKKILIEDVMTVLRANYTGTVLEGKADRPIGVIYTAESHIIALHDNMPQGMKGIIWQAISTPLGAPYMPLYACLKDIPNACTLGSNQYTPLSAYWSFRGLYSLENLYIDNYKEPICCHWQKKEQQFLKENSFINSMLQEMYKSDKQLAANFANNYSSGVLYETIGDANKIRNELMTLISQISKEPKN